MPHDLFGDVVARPQAAGPRRSPLVVASVGVHVALIAGFVVFSIVTPEALPSPSPSGPFCFCVFDTVDIQLLPSSKPSRAPDSRQPATDAAPLASEAPAPTSAPDGVTGETGREGSGHGSRGSHGDGPVIADRIETLFPGNRDFEPPPPAAPPAAPVRLHSGIRAPRRLNEIAPVYPAIARDAHVEGVVILEATIDAGGAVQTARVLRSIPLLDEAALTAVRQWQFEPALLNGQPVAVIMTVTVKFTLNR